MTTRADELVAEWLVRRYRAEYGDFGEMADILDDLEKGREPS